VIYINLRQKPTNKYDIQILEFITGEKIKTCHDKQKLKQFLITESALQKRIKLNLYTEGKHSHAGMGINKFPKMSRYAIVQ
jgi:hypothetical protein